MKNVPTPEILDFESADKRLDEALSNVFEGGYDTVLLFDGDVAVEGDFLEAIAKLAPSDDYELIAINGNLTVKGRIASYDYHPGIFVSGHTRGETLEGGDCEIYVDTATIDYFLYGYYNDGILETSDVDVPYVVNSNHHMCWSGAKGAVTIDNYGDDDDYDFGSENINKSFVPEVLNEEGDEVDIDKLYVHLKEGMPVLREGAMTAEQATLADIDKAIAAKQTTLDLSGRKLKSFPARICEMTWLVKLDLRDNQLGDLPPDIGRMAAIEELRLDKCHLGTLPDELCNLANLRVLSVASNNRHDFERTPSQVPIVLPTQLGDLLALEELNVSGLSAQHEQKAGQVLADMTEYSLPDSTAKLTKLRHIIAEGTNICFPQAMHGMASITQLSLSGGSWAYLKAVPAAIATFSNLEILDLSGNFLEEIPEDICELVKLRELDLSGALACLEKPLPDLSALTELRKLGFSGSSSHTGVRNPSHEVLAQLFAMTLANLEQLDIDRWGAEKQYRTALPPDLIKDIGQLSKLQQIDLSFNGLTALPDGFYELADLRRADLRYNALRKTERQRIAKTFPTTTIDLRDQRFKDGEQDDSADAQQMSALVKQANKLRDKGEFDGALAAYDQALVQIADGSVDNPYNQLYSLYGKAWIYSQLGYIRKDIAEADKAAARQRGTAASEQALALVPHTIWHFTDEGQFQREVIRFCGNFVAWELQANATGSDDVSVHRALKTIERAVGCIDGHQHHYLVDTQVRVLLKMGRSDDAYRAAHAVLHSNPDFADLADIKADPGYQQWAR